MVADTFAQALGAQTAALLFHARTKQRIHYKELAHETGIKERTLYKYLQGETPIPIPQFSALCLALGLEPSEVMAEATRLARGEE